MPEFADWTLWVEGTKRAMGSVGVSYIYKMIETSGWDRESKLVFVTTTDPPVALVDPSALAYKTEVVLWSAKCSKVFADENPTSNDQTTLTNYNTIEQEIISF